MKKVISIILFSFLILLQTASVCAQSSLPSNLQERRAFWFSRAEEITYDSLKNTVFLSPLEQSILYARLGEAWWKDKPEEARLWLQKAVYAVELVPNRENPTEKQQRIATARLLFSIASRVDKDLSNRLLNVFTSESDAGSENQQIADILIESALSLVDKNPQRAVELGTISMRFGSSNAFASLIWHLQVRSPELAKKLFLSALNLARENRDVKWLSLLGYTAITEGDDSNLKSALPRDLQIELLKLYFELVQGTSINDENQKQICNHVSSFIIPFRAKFNQFLPAQAEQINPIISRCQTVFSPFEKEKADQSSETRPLKTIEDYLKAADDEKDLKVKMLYQYKAAQMAFGQRNYERAISILDGMSEESRRLLRGTWEGHRWEWAADFALQLFKQGSELEINQVLEKVPSDIRGMAQIDLADKLPDKKPIPFITELLGNAEKNLARSKQPNQKRIEGYLVLMRLYAKHKQIDEAVTAIKEIVKLVNQTNFDETSENKKSGLSVLVEDKKLFLEGIPAVIFERREHSVNDAVASISLLPKRLLTRLELLNLCLTEYKTLSGFATKN
jgi:tetratricopeptide (TPR) repeat protein